jgi:hypothetical protein
LWLSGNETDIKGWLKHLGTDLRYYKRNRALRYPGEEFMENSLSNNHGRSFIDAKRDR